MRGLAGPVLAVGLFLSLASAAAAEPLVVPPFDLYETAPIQDADLARLSLAGWQVLHQERVNGATWILLALPDGALAQDVAGSRPRYLGRVRSGERVVIAAPPRGGEERLRTGRSVTISPSGAGVSITSEDIGPIALHSHDAFRTLERPLPTPRPRANGPAGALKADLERARGSGAGLRSADDVRALVDRVRQDSLEAYVRYLAQTTSGSADNRWWDPGQPGDASSIVAKSDYVRRKLQDYLGDSSSVAVYQHGFNVRNASGQTVRVYNIIGRHPSSIPGAGAILVTAHLDAIGVRSDPAKLCQLPSKIGTPCTMAATDTCRNLVADSTLCKWDSSRDPAPGADDNATGIAAMLEAARILSSVSFDFDLYFVAFQAEEIGLVGSAAFADSVVGSGQPVFGVLNMDMLGYNAVRNQLEVVTDESSGWLADWVVQSAQQFVPQLPMTKLQEPFGRSDHASFWARGIDAVLLLEDIDLPYPGYHTYKDTWETTFPSTGRPNSELQFLMSSQVIIASLARLAVLTTAPDLALPPGELVARPVAGRSFIAGEDILLTAHVHNLGNSSLTFGATTTDSLTARVTFFHGDPARGGRTLGAVTKKAFFASGGVVDFDLPWSTAGVSSGFQAIFAEVEGLDSGYAQTEVSPANDATSTSIFLQAPDSEGPRTLTNYVFPNPVRGSRSGLQLYYELTHDAGVEIDVYDVGGLLVGYYRLDGSVITNGNHAGVNRIDASQFHWNGSDLESGVYLYVIRTTGAGHVNEVRGKFAVVR
ncbi:MAG: M28 family peptidase [bacterium]